MTDYVLRTLQPDAETDLSSYSRRLRQLLALRDITEGTAAEQFLHPDYDQELHDPLLLNDMKKAVMRIAAAIEVKETIGIFSDYDCDGIPGAVVLHDGFKLIGYDTFINHIPHRHYDGFGLSVGAVESLHGKGVTLIITIDCGTSDVAAVARANELGIDVIITDHHEPKEVLPDAIAIVNPKVGDTYPFPHLCGAAVVFKLVQAILATGAYEVAPGQEKWLLDMVGIATIADMVPLTGENRVLAHYGLTVLRKSRRPGLQQLLKAQRVSPQFLTEEDVGFTIGPRINAASRMDTPEDAFALLTTTDVSEAGATLTHLEKLNTERKTAVAQMTKDLHKRLDVSVAIPDVIVMGNPDWRPALVGLAANKLAEEHNRPVFLWGRDGNGASKGSTRSNGLVSIITIMEAAADSFIEYGGHHFSGGFTVKDEAIFDLQKRILTAYESLGEQAAIAEPLQVDLTLTLDECDAELLSAQKQCAPFGMDNHKPLYLVTKVAPTEVALFGKGKEHTKLLFQTSGVAREAIAFFKTPEQFSVTPQAGQELSLLAHLEESFFMGRPQVRLRIVDIL